MPVRVRVGCLAGRVQRLDLLRRQFPALGSQILSQLFFVARAHDDCRHRGPLQQPVQRDLRNGLTGFFRNFVDCIHHLVQIFIGHRRAHIRGLVQAAPSGAAGRGGFYR